MGAGTDLGGTTRQGGFFDSLRAVMASFVGLLQTRLDLASTEIEEERERLKELMLLAAISIFCVSLGVILLTGLVVIVFWETHRFSVLGGLALTYLAAGATAGLVLRKKAAARPRLFAATCAELAKDRERLES
jgi:uncharacterized membrane protein YqjE